VRDGSPSNCLFTLARSVSYEITQLAGDDRLGFAGFRLAEMHDQAGSLGARFKQMKTQPQEVTPQMQLANFYHFFPNFAATPDLLEKLYSAAEASGIVLEQGDYRRVSSKEDKLESYQVTLPVRGSYPAVRKFLGRVLADLPTISLDSISFQRQKIGDTIVETQIKLTLYLDGEV
jgi:Tfp pilus assembly protein PilO